LPPHLGFRHVLVLVLCHSRLRSPWAEAQSQARRLRCGSMLGAKAKPQVGGTPAAAPHLELGCKLLVRFHALFVHALFNDAGGQGDAVEQACAAAAGSELLCTPAARALRVRCAPSAHRCRQPGAACAAACQPHPRARGGRRTSVMAGCGGLRPAGRGLRRGVRRTCGVGGGGRLAARAAAAHHAAALRDDVHALGEVEGEATTAPQPGADGNAPPAHGGACNAPCMRTARGGGRVHRRPCARRWKRN